LVAAPLDDVTVIEVDSWMAAPSAAAIRRAAGPLPDGGLAEAFGDCDEAGVGQVKIKVGVGVGQVDAAAPAGVGEFDRFELAAGDQAEAPLVRSGAEPVED
jgi:hypothetical protein